MDLQDLTEFLVVADTRSFADAAARLHVSPTALTRHIQRLESHLKVKLMDRSGPPKLTAVGRKFLPKAAKLVRDAEQLEWEMLHAGKSHQTDLNVGFPHGVLHFSLTGALAQFRKKHENVRVQLHELNLVDQLSSLRKEKLDVAVVGQPWPELSREFDLFDLGSIPLCAVLSRTHPLAASSFDLKDLRGEEFIGLCDETCPGQTASMTAACRKAGFEPNFTATALGKSAMLIMVGASRHVGLLPAIANKIPQAGAGFHPLSHMVPCCAAVRSMERRSTVRGFLFSLQQEFRKVANSFGFVTPSPPPIIRYDRKKIPNAPNGA